MDGDFFSKAQGQSAWSVTCRNQASYATARRQHNSPDNMLLFIAENETPKELAEKIRAEIKDATRCTASVGISSNILLARMCTRVAKPDGCYYLSPADDVNLFMGVLHCRNI